MNRAGLRTARQFTLWKEGVALLDGLCIDGENVDAELYLEDLTNRYSRWLVEHEGSGTLQQAETQILELEGAAKRMASALKGLGLEARQTIFGDGLGMDSSIFREGFAFEGGFLPSAEDFNEFAQACALAARECQESSRFVKNGTPKFRSLLSLPPNQALVGACEDALIRVERTEKLHTLVRIIAELATGEKPDREFERACQSATRARKPNHS